MLPDSSDITTRGTMQSGELKQSTPEEASSQSNMTVSQDSTSPKPQLTPEDFTFASADDKLEMQESEMELKKHRRRSSESRSSPTLMDDDHPEDDARLLESICQGDEIFNKMREQNPNESVRNWLQRITQMQHEIQKKRVNCENVPHAVLDFQKRTVTANGQATVPLQNATSRVVKYQDLPYMGEMTLENSKPRRGRKPKKADICHLIYKNYGTIFPGTPKNLVAPEALKRQTAKQLESKDPNFMDNPNRTDVQNKIISSLLERRLTQESRSRSDLRLSSDDRKSTPTKSPTAEQLAKDSQDEPLNLCVRDLNQLKIRLLRKHGNVYTSEAAPEVKCEPQSDDDIEIISEAPSPMLNPNLADPKVAALSPEDFRLNFPELVSKSPEGAAPGGYVYWPNAGVFIHPIALQQHLMYYQRLAANNNYTLPSSSSSPKQSPQETSLDELRHSDAKTPRSSTKSPPEVDLTMSPPEPRVKRNASTSSSEKAPVKRKRSAIFIPPIPSENQTNPATEVSICKFKFTGGAKPSLQEKKMLSVDSGGNFRYYSGTGDKSMRGYEFFPRETLQQQVENAQGSSTGAFLQASGEKIYPVPSPIDFTGKQCHPDFMMTACHSPLEPRALQSLGGDLGGSQRHRKRKTKKSLQREKLEQTFKEKGFLIQTQQLESAEGATYCKFRQLRKFTRYLFRSWKDYLPGSVRELQEGERSEEDGPPIEGDIEQIQITPAISPDSLT